MSSLSSLNSGLKSGASPIAKIKKNPVNITSTSSGLRLQRSGSSDSDSNTSNNSSTDNSPITPLAKSKLTSLAKNTNTNLTPLPKVPITNLTGGSKSSHSTSNTISNISTLSMNLTSKSNHSIQDDSSSDSDDDSSPSTNDSSPNSSPSSPNASSSSSSSSSSKNGNLQFIQQKMQEDNGDDVYLITLSPFGNEKNTVNDELEALNKLSKDKANQIAEEAMKNCLKCLSSTTSNDDSPSFHEGAAKKLKDMGNTGKKIFSSLAKHMDNSPIPIIDFDHLTTLGDTGGYHLDLQDQTQGLSIQEIAMNPGTKIRFATVSNQQKSKKSTLFPSGTDKKGLITLLKNSTKIAQCDNRILLQTAAGYCIECYRRDTVRYASMFPLFYYGECVPQTNQYQLHGGLSLTGKEIEALASLPSAKISYVTWIGNANNTNNNNNNNSAEVTEMKIDIGPSLAEEGLSQVDKGVVFSFKKSDFPALFKTKETQSPEFFRKKQ